MAIGEKLAALLKEKNKKPGTLARETGISKNTIYSILKRNNAKVNLSIIERIADALDVPIDYFFPTSTNKSPFEYDEVLHVCTRQIPILGGAACGEPLYQPGDGTEYIGLDGDTACDFALIAHGDSMIGDRIFDGDVVFFRAQENVLDGEIAAVCIDDGVTIKRVNRVYGADGFVSFTQLLSSNPKFAPIIIGGEGETRSVHIMGKAVAFKALLNNN